MPGESVIPERLLMFSFALQSPSYPVPSTYFILKLIKNFSVKFIMLLKMQPGSSDQNGFMSHVCPALPSARSSLHPGGCQQLEFWNGEVESQRRYVTVSGGCQLGTLPITDHVIFISPDEGGRHRDETIRDKNGDFSTFACSERQIRRIA